jgi:hypothetical protein
LTGREAPTREALRPPWRAEPASSRHPFGKHGGLFLDKHLLDIGTDLVKRAQGGGLGLKDSGRNENALAHINGIGIALVLQ